MSPAPARRSRNSDDAAWIVFVPVVFAIAALVIGIPGLGTWFGMMIAAAFAAHNAKVKPGRRAKAPVPGQEFLAALREYIGHPFSPAVGTGSAVRWFPPVRLSALWAMVAAGLLGFTPVFVHEAGVPFPKFLHAAIAPGLCLISAFGYWFAIQAVLAAKRAEQPPVLIEWAEIKKTAPKFAPAAIFGVAAAALVFVGLTDAHQLAQLFAAHKAATASTTPGTTSPSTYAGLGRNAALLLSMDAFVLVFAAIASAIYASDYMVPHHEAVEKHTRWVDEWRNVLNAKTPIPTFRGEQRIPEESPNLCSATFDVPPGGTIEAYEAAAEKLGPILQTSLVSVHPDVARTPEGAPMMAASTTTFKVEYPLVPLGASPHLSREFTERSPLLDTIVSTTFRRIFSELKLGQPLLFTLAILTMPESPARLVETMWLLGPGVTFDQVAKAAHTLAEKSGARWLRVGRRSTLVGPTPGDVMSSQFVSILFGDPPERAIYAAGKRLTSADHERFVERVEWEARFRACGLATAETSPVLLDRATDANGVTDWVFSYPPGLAAADVENKMEQLRAASSEWVAFRRHVDQRKFRLLTAESDPLQRPRPFMEWAPKVLHSPRPGQSWLKWVVGVGTDNQLVSFEFDTDAPHLLIAGETNSGKSMCLSSMILQLAVANGPEDLNFRLADPKTELSHYAELAHVTHFVEARADRPIYGQFAMLLEDTLAEAMRRFDMIKDCKEVKLTDAKAKGALLDVPYIVVVMDEVAMLLNPPESALKNEIQASLTQLANIGRAAGIFLVMATQYPSNATVPNHLREQFSRVGFKVRDIAASRIIIESKGLEVITAKGLGMIYFKGQLTSFRGFLLDPGTLDSPSDQDRILVHLPKAVAKRTSGTNGVMQSITIPAPAAGVFKAPPAA